MISLALAALAVLLLVVAGPGVRMEWWGIRTGFTFLQWAAYVGLAALAVALLQLLVRAWRGPRPWAPALALVLGALSAGVPWYWRHRAEQVPPIHDITTDTHDPPAFVAILPLRAGAPNAAAYGGDSVAAAQAAGYPDLEPVHLAEAPGAVFHRALAAAHAMGWELVAADSLAGRIEATATTGWFGFKDDVVVRVRPAAGAASGSVLDVRSVSRVGQSDVGTNARRIRAFLARLHG